MPKITTVKAVVSAIAGYGSGVIVYAIIRNNLPEDLPPHKQAAAVVGAFAIGGIVAEATSNYTDRIIDDIVDAVEEVKANRK